MDRLTTIDALRGLASFSVCWYHLVFANHAFVDSGLAQGVLRDSARNAWIGVEVFFVISGFVIPLALYRARYALSGYGRFLLKRLVRLDPPYLVSILVCVALAYLSASVHRLHGPPFHLSITALLLHIGYLNAFSGKPWLNPVYWTLAIEFQYYLGMGILFVALANRRAAVRAAVYPALAALALLIPSSNLVFHYLFVFLLGMATFQYRVGLLTLRLYLPLVALISAGCYVTLGPMVTGAALFTALAIGFVRTDIRPLIFLGSISYSLYLVHVPVGGRAMNLLLPHAHSLPARFLVLALSLGLSLVCAYALYRLVERPAQRWSGAFRYRGEPRAGGTRRPTERARGAVTGIAEPSVFPLLSFHRFSARDQADLRPISGADPIPGVPVTTAYFDRQMAQTTVDGNLTREGPGTSEVPEENRYQSRVTREDYRDVDTQAPHHRPAGNRHHRLRVWRMVRLLGG